jgi:nicotinamidase-related amidase
VIGGGLRRQGTLCACVARNGNQEAIGPKSKIRAKGAAQGQTCDARTQARNAEERALGQEGQEQETGDRDRTFTSAPLGSQSSEKALEAPPLQKKSVSSARANDGRASQIAGRRSRAVLLLIDVVNRFEFEGGKALLKAARPVSRKIATLRARAARVRMPVVFVNDNFGRWRSDFRAIVGHCLREEAPGRDIVSRLEPAARDYFVLKPSNSAFYATVLETLLRHFDADTLILTGLATDNCVLFTAHDAYLRGYKLFVPRDCAAAESPRPRAPDHGAYDEGGRAHE